MKMTDCEKRFVNTDRHSTRVDVLAAYDAAWGRTR
jgi:hypothetical protein